MGHAGDVPARHYPAAARCAAVMIAASANSDLGMLHISGLGRGCLGHMDRTTADKRAACRKGRQFRKGHPNRHKRCSLYVSLSARCLGNAIGSTPLCHKKARELLMRQRC